MHPAFWFAWRELVARKTALVAGVGMVCAAVTFCAATELVLRSRGMAVAAEIDQIGPALRLIPAGRTATDLARFDLGDHYFTQQDLAQIRSALRSQTREVEGRLLLNAPYEGGMVSLVGIDPRSVISPFAELRALGKNELALGTDLARRLGKGKGEGDELRLRGTSFRVAAVLDETASADDSAVFLPIDQLRELFGLGAVVNEMRVFPLPGASVERIASLLTSSRLKINVINTYRGETAEDGMSRSLREHRRVLYAITAVVIGLCILVWSYLNGGERRLELATVVAVGGTNVTVLLMLVIRAAIVGFIGALVGYLVGAGIALGQDFDSAWRVVFSGSLLLATLCGAVVVSSCGALVASVCSAFRKHVSELQQ